MPSRFCYSLPTCKQRLPQQVWLWANIIRKASCPFCRRLIHEERARVAHSVRIFTQLRIRLSPGDEGRKEGRQEGCCKDQFEGRKVPGNRQACPARQDRRLQGRQGFLLLRELPESFYERD